MRCARAAVLVDVRHFKYRQRLSVAFTLACGKPRECRHRSSGPGLTFIVLCRQPDLLSPSIIAASYLDRY